MMFKDPLGWFPDALFSNLFPMVVFAVFFIDYLIPRLTTPARQKTTQVTDRGSFTMISTASLGGILAGILIRIGNMGISVGPFQWMGMTITLAGLALRGWALLKLGRFFSRTVQIETGHRIIKDGPYKWIRHPAYMGMVLIYAGFILSIGTWLGALITSVIIVVSLIYRINVEEKLLLETFGDEYRGYMAGTWRLFPGW